MAGLDEIEPETSGASAERANAVFRLVESRRKLPTSTAISFAF